MDKIKFTKKYTIKGLVQGIGYRPFVAGQAETLGLSGYVRNTGGIVSVIACGSEDDLQQLHHRLSCDVPTGGFVTSIDVEDVNIDSLEKKEADLLKDNDFKIIQSDEDSLANLPLIPADIATCENCTRELLDRNNRRYQHPFISCTICGPRYSIIERLPYDRDTITMADFDMCPSCAREYTGKQDRRRHAQTIACKDCGPVLSFFRIKDTITENVTEGGKVDNDVDICNENDIDAEIAGAVAVIKAGGILAVKDIGGYHLCCDSLNYKAVAALRTLKHREAKAFAVMFENLDQLREYCFVNDKEEELLESPARPIVLVRRRGTKALAENVCLNSPDIGAMLPGNPVQIMLAKYCGPIIMTSGNASGDVLEIDNEKMTDWLKNRVASGDMNDTPVAILSHNRRILRPMDDSVMKVVRGRQQFIRRGRGHVPNPVAVDIDGEIYAAGGDLKSSFCYVKNGLAYVSQYLGDLESVSCQKFYKNEMEAMKQIFGFAPERIVTDKHPGYFSRKEAQKLAKQRALPVEQVQHHKAHVLSVIAEHGLKGKVIGFAFDGTGYGDDGSIWGSEAFIWEEDLNTIQRVAHLKQAKLIGGDEGAKNCDTILSGMLHGNNLDAFDKNDNSTLLAAALDNNINVVTSTSMGRLFDAVSAMLDVCHYNSYEGQAPIELENVAATAEKAYKLQLHADGDTTELFRGIAYAIEKHVPKEEIALGFIETVANFVVEIADSQSINQVVLSGGTFLNRILTEKVIDDLEAKGFKVYIAEQLPAGDGGICLGQVVLG